MAEGEVRRQQPADASHKHDAAISISGSSSGFAITTSEDCCRSVASRFDGPAAARCFDQASFEVMGQRAVAAAWECR